MSLTLCNTHKVMTYIGKEYLFFEFVNAYIWQTPFNRTPFLPAKIYKSMVQQIYEKKEKRYVGGLYTVYVIIHALFLYFLPFCYPYIINAWHYLFMSFLQQAHTWIEVCHHTSAEFCPHKQHILTIDSGVSYTGNR